jgi:hypothetical protein
VSPELAQSLFVLAQPERELVMRIFRTAADPDTRSHDTAAEVNAGTDNGHMRRSADIVRVCLALRGNDHAFAVRTGDEYDVQSVWSDGSSATLARPLLSALGSCAAAESAEFSAPSHELSERLDEATVAADYADACFALGVPGRESTVLGLAFESCHSYAEIVAYDHDDGITTRTPGAIAVYDTGRGRIVVTPGIAPDQTSWSTVTPGTDQRIAQAISALVEMLPGGRWLRQ